MDQEKARELIAEIVAASQAVIDMAGRAQVVKPGEPLDPGEPITEEWAKKWMAALRRERKAIKAWRMFATGEQDDDTADN